jgi:hypothetical protein
MGRRHAGPFSFVVLCRNGATRRRALKLSIFGNPAMLFTWRLIALVLCALSLGPSFAHALEAPPRLNLWPPELWRETTVFRGQFAVFGLLGGPLDGGAVIVTAGLAWLTRGQGAAFRWALAAAVAFAASLAVWIVVVNGANHIMAGWRPGPLPADFQAVRTRWEGGHIAIAAIKALGFAALAVSCLITPSGRR